MCPPSFLRIRLPDALAQVVREFAEHYHDEWAMSKIDAGWTIGRIYDEDKKDHPNLRNFNGLHDTVSMEVSSENRNPNLNRLIGLFNERSLILD